MNVLDIIIAIPLIFFIYRGWKKGLVIAITTLIGVIAGAYAALHFSRWMAGVLGLDGENSLLIAFFVTFVGVVVLAFLIGKAVEGLLKMTHLSIANRLAGAAVSMAICLGILSVILGWVAMIDRHEIVLKAETKQQSALYRPTISVGSQITNKLKVFVDEQRCKMSLDKDDQ